jgi:hypothetical protein
MGSAVWLNCTGLDDLDAKTHSEVVVRLRQVLEPLCKDAGKTLTITKGDHRGDLNLEFDLCPSSGLGNLLGDDAGESVFVRAHQDMRVCGPVDPKTNTRDTRRFLNASVARPGAGQHRPARVGPFHRQSRAHFGYDEHHVRRREQAEAGGPQHQDPARVLGYAADLQRRPEEAPGGAAQDRGVAGRDDRDADALTAARDWPEPAAARRAGCAERSYNYRPEGDFIDALWRFEAASDPHQGNRASCPRKACPAREARGFSLLVSASFRAAYPGGSGRTAPYPVAW